MTFSWIFNFPWHTFFMVAKMFIIILDIIIFGLMVYAFKRAWEVRPKLSHHLIPRVRVETIALDTKLLQTRWKTLVLKAHSAPPQSFVLALIEADKFIDDVLKQLGYTGEHMADRLGQINDSDAPSLPKVWRVHKIRNELVHTPDFEINPVDAQEMLDVYAAFLKELKIV